MKKILLSLGVILALNASSQITIDSTNMPQAGDTLRYSIATLDSAVLLNYRASGANLTWNFDSLQPIDQRIQRFVNSSETDYASSVPSRIGLLFADTLSLGGFSIYNAYNFLKSSDSSFSIDYRGASIPNPIFAGGPPFMLTSNYVDPDEVFQFPLDYNDRDSSTFNFVYSNPLGAYYASSGYRINHVDAWGDLTTPYGTFSCIRVVTDMVSYDTVSIAAFLAGSDQNFGVNSHTREYQWIADEIKIPALKVNGNVVAGVFIPTTVEYRDSVRNIPSLIPTIAFFRTDTNVVTLSDTVDFDNFSIGGNNLQFEWSFSPARVSYVNSLSTSRNISVTFTDTGFYDVQLIAFTPDEADTSRRENYIQVLSTTGLENINQELGRQIKVYPNPGKRNAAITLETKEAFGDVEIQLLDAKGAELSTALKKVFNEKIVLTMPESQGVYYLKIRTSKGIAIKKVVTQ